MENENKIKSAAEHFREEYIPMQWNALNGSGAVHNCTE